MSSIPFTIVDGSSVTIFSGTIVVDGSNNITNLYSTANPSTDLLVHSLAELQAILVNFTPPSWTFNTPTYDPVNGYLLDVYMIHNNDITYQPTAPVGVGSGTVVVYSITHNTPPPITGLPPSDDLSALNDYNSAVTTTGMPPPSLTITYTGFGGGGGGGGASCYAEGTRILMEDSTEKSIENLRVGDMVMTYAHGPRRVTHIGSVDLVNDPKKWYNCLFVHKESGLTITGGHSILVGSLNPVEEKIIREINYPIREIDGMYTLLSTIACSRFEQVKDNIRCKIYHFVVESDDHSRQYGVYANGVLSETISYDVFAQSFERNMNVVEKSYVESEKIMCA